MSLALLLVSCCVYAENNVTVVSGEEFEKYGDRIISENCLVLMTFPENNTHILLQKTA
jgi:hypothetical protein